MLIADCGSVKRVPQHCQRRAFNSVSLSLTSAEFLLYTVLYRMWARRFSNLTKIQDARSYTPNFDVVL